MQLNVARMYKLGLASKQKARVTLARISRYFVIVVKFQYRIPFQLDQEKCSLQKQPSFFAPGPSGVSREGRLRFIAGNIIFALVPFSSETL